MCHHDRPQREKRVLIVAELYGRGGTETHALHLCRLLVSAGASVTVAARYYNPDVPLVQLRNETPVRFITTPFALNRWWFRLSTLWALCFWRFQMGREMDVIYSFRISRFHNYLRRFLRADGRVLLNPAGLPIEPLKGGETKIHVQGFHCMRNLIDNGAVDELIVETDIHAHAAGQVFKPRHISVLPHIGHYGNPPRRTKREDSIFKISFLGRWEAAKGVYRLLEVWPELDIAPAELHYYGGGPDRRTLEYEIHHRGLSDSVRIHGPWLSPADLAEILAGTDLVVLPSESEGLPLVLLEAMAYGVPFVATDVGGIRTLQRNNPDVMVVPNDDGSLAEGICSMVHRIRSGTVVSSRLQEYFRVHFSYEMLADQWLRLFLSSYTTPESIDAVSGRPIGASRQWS
jgi:glycosyltransferase involved in cell wall biosynthesis